MQGAFDFAVIWRALPHLFLDGMTFTLTLTLIASVGGLVLGTLLALIRLSGVRPLALLSAGYVNLFRALPLVLVIFLIYFLLPYIGQWVLRTARPIAVGALPSAMITFTLFEAAYFSEIMRAGIQSVRPGQVAAAEAIGLGYAQVMRYVVLPQALRTMLPVLFTQTIVLFQDTSLVYVLSITDFLGAATQIAHRDGRLVEMYLFTALIYFLISFTASRFVKRLNRRLRIIR